LKDPEFYKDYKKMVGEQPSPLMPEEFDAVMKNFHATGRMWNF
jgi:hypothetical protein